jgi:ERCC4-type nuclease
MLIKIDVRETALLQQINSNISLIPAFKSLKVQTEPLPIGDIIINDGIEDKIIIERKTVDDLLSSIKDGRYEEQSYRLNGSTHHNHNIIYLIEGDVNQMNKFKKIQEHEKLMFYSALFSINYYKGFSAFRSFSLTETATIICNMAYKMEKDTTKKAYYQQSNPNPEENVETKENMETNDDDKNYVSVVKKIKKDNITPDNIGEIMLCQIPGISSVTAIAIITKYKTIANLIKELELDNDTMKDLSYTNDKGQVRKINKTSIANIVKFLLKK